MSFSPVWSSFGLIARSICLNTAQLLHHRPISTVCRQPARLARAYVPKTWISNRLGTEHTVLRNLPGLLTATGVAGIAFGVATCTAPTIHCDSQGMYK